jgi:transglutaminase-like putative cysteine protease
MNIDRPVEERIRTWLQETAPRALPDRVLDSTFAETRSLGQTSRILRWKLPRALALPVLSAVGTVAVVVIAVAVGFGRSESAQVGGPLTAVIPQVWHTDDSVAATIARDPADDHGYYWRALAYDQIDLNSMSLSASKTTERIAGANVLDGMADDVDPTGLRPFTFTVQPGTFKEATVLSPATPVRVDEAVRVTTVGQAGYFATIDRQDIGGGPYTVTAMVPVTDDGAGTVDASALRAAGTAYPPEVDSLYTTVVAGMFGPNLTALRDQVVETAPSGAPYDLAERLLEILSSPVYTYDTDLGDIDCRGMSTPECFATSKHGFCQQYSMTMAVVLRDLGVPARIVVGFLPGERSPGSGLEVIRNTEAHAWVEVYFPGRGWVAFDPTAGALFQRLPAPQRPSPVEPTGTLTP